MRLLVRGRRPLCARIRGFILSVAPLAGILRGAAPRVILRDRLAGRRVVPFVATASSLVLADLIRTSLPTNDREATIAVRLHENLAHFRWAHSAANRARQKVALFILDPSQRLHIILQGVPEKNPPFAVAPEKNPPFAWHLVKSCQCATFLCTSKVFPSAILV